MYHPETVVVQREKSEDNPTGLVTINKADFDEAVDKLAAEPAAEAEVSVVIPAPATTEVPAATETEVPAPWAKK
jgi:hypothetical protein